MRQDATVTAPGDRPRTGLRLLVIATVLSGAAVAGARQDPGLDSVEVSASGLFLAGYTKREDPDGAPTSRTGLFAQQLELRADARVGPRSRAVVSLDLPRGSATVDRVELGETYLAVDLSPEWAVQAGRFDVDFGRQNRLHPHEQPFLDPPLAFERLFGPGGIREVGVGVRRRLPLPWDAGLALQIVNGDNERWVNPTDEDLLYVLHTRHAGRLGGLRFELGGSWAAGRNPTERWTHALGADLTVDAGGSRWQTEYVRVAEDLKRRRQTTGGVTSYLQYRLAGRWWAQGRYDYYGLPIDGGRGWEDRGTVLLAYVPSERTPIRFQYSRWRVDDLGRGFNQYHVQLSFTLGPHHATPYGAGAAAVPR